MKKRKIKKTKNMSNKERIVLERASELEYDTDRLGAGSLMTQQSHINASRLIMVNHNIPHMVNIKNPDAPLVPSGFENTLASFSSMLDKTDAQYEIVAKFEKNEYNYVLIGFDKKNRVYHAWKREELREQSEGFGTRYNNQYIDSLEIGDKVPEGTYIKKSDSFDKYMNYRFGRNLNTVYMVSTCVYEDGICIMNGAEKMLNTFRCHKQIIALSDNELLLNWYGDDSHYQGIPMIGEKTRNGYLAIVRQIDGATAPYALKRRRLQHVERGDRKIYAEGRVVDITIRYNKDRDKLNDSPSNQMIADLYDEQQKFYMKLYEYMQGIADQADDEGFTYTDEFSIICEEAHDFVDASAFFADSNDNVFGNMQIEVTLMHEEPLIVGSKLVGRYGNKGVISMNVPPEKSWTMEDGTPVHVVVATLGVLGRLNQSQLNEHSCTELSATAVEMMKTTDDLDQKGKIVVQLLNYLNKDEAKAFKQYFKSLSGQEKAKCCRKIEQEGITIFQDPLDNANITDFEQAYEQFPPKWQRICFADGTKSIRKVLCSKMFFMRLKQDPVEKYSARSNGPVNPLSHLPAKSNQKKKSLDPYSDVAVRLGEAEQELLNTMVNHPAAIADFMTENSTSLPAKLARAEDIYLQGLESDEMDITRMLIDCEDMDIGEIIEDDDLLNRSFQKIMENQYAAATGKKNMEQIIAYLNELSIDIEFDTEEAEPGKYFHD